MKKAKFETNLKCEGCVETLAKHIIKLDFVQNWEVDLASDKKTLTVTGETLDKSQIIRSVEEAGFTAREKKGFFNF